MLAMLSATMAARMAMFMVNSPEGCSRLAGGLGGRMTIRQTLRSELLHCAPVIFRCPRDLARGSGVGRLQQRSPWSPARFLHRRLAVPRLPRLPIRGTGRLSPTVRVPILPACSSSLRLRPLRSAPSTSKAASSRPRSSCAGCSQPSPTPRRPVPVPGPLPAGSRCPCHRARTAEETRSHVTGLIAALTTKAW
jgi:hypothetical protein